MEFEARDQLTIVEMRDGDNYFLIKELIEILMEYPSNVIYCERSGKLVGIISTGDIMRAYEKKQHTVIVNTKFTCIHYGEYEVAKQIFQEKKCINAIPVVSDGDILIGNYIRWDDMLLLEHLIETDNGRCAKNLKNSSKIILVQPSVFFMTRHEIFEKFLWYLKSQKLEIICVSHLEVQTYLQMNNTILFVDENEKRACNTRLNIILGNNFSGCDKLKTYRNIFSKRDRYNEEECVLYFKRLQDKGIKIIGLIFEESTYYKKVLNKITERFAAIGEEPSSNLPRLMYSDFFDDLYNEEYAELILSMPIEYVNNAGVYSLKDCSSQYMNIINGERYTANQPEQYQKSIYFFGPCYIYGHYVEDKNTIESLLQEEIIQISDKIRVVNSGGWCGAGRYSSLSRMATVQLKKGDLIVVDRPPKDVNGLYYLNLVDVLEKNNVGAEWLVDNAFHCNHKVNKLYANAIYEVLSSILQSEVEGSGDVIQKEDNVIEVFYLQRYFADFHFGQNENIGSVVMNCNPFTLGHRYLIEQALKIVDFLIIFVVEEDKSFFTFSERFAMVREGVADLDNVMVVPSGPFILSQMTFPEYFVKEKGEKLMENTENDVRVFAKDIALRLGIRYRFFGEEPFDEVTNQYNTAMKKILPQYGIKAIEIPRKTIHESVISATTVRKYISEKAYDCLNELLPETTKRLLGLSMEMLSK